MTKSECFFTTKSQFLAAFHRFKIFPCTVYNSRSEYAIHNNISSTDGQIFIIKFRQ